MKKTLLIRSVKASSVRKRCGGPASRTTSPDSPSREVSCLFATRRVGRLLGCLVGLCLIAATNTIVAQNHRTVALSGDAAVGTESGVLFSAFGSGGFRAGAPPVLNNSGDVAFVAELEGSSLVGEDGTGIWYSKTNGEQRLVARENSNGANVAAPQFGSFLRGIQPVLNNAGQIGFEAGVNAAGNGFFRYTEATGVETIAGVGTVPGAPGSAFTASSPGAFNDNGEVAVAVGAGSFVSPSTEIWSNGNGNAGLIGVSNPGVPRLNNAGDVAVFGTTDSAGESVTGFWKQSAGTLELVAGVGSSLPGISSDAQLANTSTLLAFNDAGQTAFSGFVSGTGITDANDGGIWSEAGGNGLALVAREGDPAPGTAGAVFGSLGEPLLNANNDIAFVAGALFGLDDLRSGIWRGESGGGLTQVVVDGDMAPGVEADEDNFVRDVFVGVGGGNGSVFGPGFAFNAAGQVAFSASLGVAANDPSFNLPQGIWAEDRSGALQLIALEGQMFDVNDDPLIEDLRVIGNLAFTGGSGNEDGLPSGFNDLGQLAFFAEFTDGSSGVFVSNAAVAIPEPGLASLLMLAATVAGLRRRLARPPVLDK